MSQKKYIIFLLSCSIFSYYCLGNSLLNLTSILIIPIIKMKRDCFYAFYTKLFY